eukprot:Lankesteria_metandrocarpae@DN784_c0_g1_i1.p1
MGRILKSGRVVVVLNGRFAGRKAVVVQANDTGTKERLFPHALIAGLSRPPKKITRKMSKKQIEKRSKVRSFLTFMNYNHLMPTRYSLASSELNPKDLVSPYDLKDKEQKTQCKKAMRDTFQELIVTPNKEKDSTKVSKDVAFFRRPLSF